MNDDKPSDFSMLDRAVSRRLARLRAMPVDTTSLEQLLTRQIPRPRPSFMTAWRLPLVRGIAAAVLLVALIVSAVLMLSGGPVVASANDMAELHEGLVSGRIPALKVDSVAQANAELLKQWAESPRIPNVPNEHVMACCMHSVKNKKVACVLLGGPDQPVTMTVANSSDVMLPSTPPLTRNGISYYVQSTGSLNMVMTQRQGRCVCLIGKLPVDRLMELASGIKL